MLDLCVQMFVYNFIGFIQGFSFLPILKSFILKLLGI